MKLLEYIFTKQQIGDKFFWLRLGLAGIMIVLLVGQLFTYESFYSVLVTAQGNLSPIVVTILMVLLPIYELMTLPALLSMTVSSTILRASAYAARIVSLLLVAMVVNSLAVAPETSAGLLGDTIYVPAHLVTLLLVALYAVAIWYATARQVELPKKK